MDVMSGADVRRDSPQHMDVTGDVRLFTGTVRSLRILIVYSVVELHVLRV